MFLEFKLAKGLLGRRAKKDQARRARQIGEYNAKVAELNAKVQKDALVQESRKLVKSQREEKAQQRMSIASRGGLEAGGDLLAMINSAKDMQLDLLEMETQQDIALYRGKIEAQQIRMGAKAQSDNLKAEGKMSLINSVTSGVMDFFD